MNILCLNGDFRGEEGSDPNIIAVTQTGALLVPNMQTLIAFHILLSELSSLSIIYLKWLKLN